MKKQGFTLVASVMLLVFLSIAILGVTTFIIELLANSNARRINTSCIYLAQAGLEASVFSYRFRDLSANGYFPLGPYSIDADHSFVLGADPDELLMVDTSNASLSAPGRQLNGLRIQNATNSQTITIDRMILTWDNSNNVRRIRINGSNVWNGNLSSPADANISDFTLDNVPTNYPINAIRFNGNMTGSNINVQFVMTDGSIRDVDVFPQSNNFNFTVKSTGKVTGSNGYRTIMAEYNAITSTVFNYHEIDEEIN